MANVSKMLLGKAIEFFVGGAKYTRAFNTYKRVGVPFTPQMLYKDFGAVAAAVSNGVSASQSVASGAAALINGSLASGGVATFATPRNVVAAWTGTAVLTVTGTDEYGSIVTEASASGTSLAGKKAFKTVTSAVFTTGAVTGATIGSGDVLGLPFRVDANGLVAARASNAIDAGTFVAADTTSPATATTGDVRGTFDPAVALNGTNRVAVVIVCADPSTKIGAYGVKQFGSTDSE